MERALEKTLAKDYMNKIRKLFDEQFVLDLFCREVLPHYSAFKSISRVEIRPYKDLVWDTTYHVVIGFNTYFLKPDGTEIKIPIFCSAHSDEPRENVYKALKYLWTHNFPGGFVDIPDPIFYSDDFRGTFYRGLRGDNMLHYIKNQDYEAVRHLVSLSARLFARLHSLPTSPDANVNPHNSRIRTVIPGLEKIYREMGERYNNKYNADLKKIYDYLTEREDKFFMSGQPLTLIHGDAHPENIIVTALDRIGLIDFTDLCLGDFARDLGAFSQQLEYKILYKVGDEDFAAEMKSLFLTDYLRAANKELTADLQARIDLYYNWTAVRTATYWFLRFGHDEKRAEILLEKVKNNLKL
ncbi:MAG: hypothetical protein Athens071426_710 [Parcubacteria group bacterium Athens0714_26]|nr:MAG: hypothetical protein Athens071426_710 [Parcubacteria group bacterium Athens0714_26]